MTKTTSSFKQYLRGVAQRIAHEVPKPREPFDHGYAIGKIVGEYKRKLDVVDAAEFDDGMVAGFEVTTLTILQ